MGDTLLFELQSPIRAEEGNFQKLSDFLTEHLVLYEMKKFINYQLYNHMWCNKSRPAWDAPVMLMVLLQLFAGGAINLDPLRGRSYNLDGFGIAICCINYAW